MSRKIGNACELREIMGTPEYLGKKSTLFLYHFEIVDTSLKLYFMIEMLLMWWTACLAPKPEKSSHILDYTIPGVI